MSGHTVEELRALRVKLKSGEYDGVDLMHAWIALDDFAGRIKADDSAVPTYWCAVHCETGEVGLCMSADDGNGGGAAHTEVNDWINDDLQENPQNSWRLVPLFGKPPALPAPMAWLLVDAKGKRFTIYNPTLAAAIKETATQVGSTLTIKAVCEVSPFGWFCTRGLGHDGPCALWPNMPPVAPAAAQLWEMKQRACRAHALCNELRIKHPDIPELGDDGTLHDAIHDILRVYTPSAEPAQAAQVDTRVFRGVGELERTGYIDAAEPAAQGEAAACKEDNSSLCRRAAGNLSMLLSTCRDELHADEAVSVQKIIDELQSAQPRAEEVAQGESSRTVADDMRDFGNGFAVDGKRIDPSRVVIYPAAPLRASPEQPAGDRDAYEGAREDLLAWKGRAQRAEAELRKLGYTGIDASEAPMAKKGGDTTLAPSAGEGWDAWGAACGFSSWAKAAEAIGITVAQMVTIRKKAPRKTIRLAMDAVLAAQPHAVPGGWRELVEWCASTAGSEVNGNQLSAKAKQLLAAAPQPGESE